MKYDTIEMESNSLVDIITQNINTIIIVINQNGELIFISKSVERILGYSPEELLGEFWWKAAQKDEYSPLAMVDYFKKLVFQAKIEEFTTERLIYDSKKNKKWMLWNSTFDNEGNLVSVGYDITNRKVYETKIKKSNELLKAKNKEILDSLNYAQTIQHSILPNSTFYKNHFSDGFVINKPKDIVSGDFYWYYERDNLIYFACIDCTGHGVPGALMTILSYNLLKNVVKHQKIKDPAEILHALDELLYDEFNNNNKIKRADGMDISLCVFDFKSNVAQFSGALHSIYFKTKLENLLREFKGKRYPIGLYHDVEKKFETIAIPFNKGDVFYFFSDGIIDQFGGINNKKFTKKRLKDILEINKNNLESTQFSLNSNFMNWKNYNEQTDDVLFIALEI